MIASKELFFPASNKNFQDHFLKAESRSIPQHISSGTPAPCCRPSRHRNAKATTHNSLPQEQRPPSAQNDGNIPVLKVPNDVVFVLKVQSEAALVHLKPRNTAVLPVQLVKVVEKRKEGNKSGRKHKNTQTYWHRQPQCSKQLLYEVWVLSQWVKIRHPCRLVQSCKTTEGKGCTRQNPSCTMINHLLPLRTMEQGNHPEEPQEIARSLHTMVPSHLPLPPPLPLPMHRPETV